MRELPLLLKQLWRKKWLYEMYVLYDQSESQRRRKTAYRLRYKYVTLYLHERGKWQGERR